MEPSHPFNALANQTHSFQQLPNDTASTLPFSSIPVEPSHPFNALADQTHLFQQLPNDTASTLPFSSIPVELPCTGSFITSQNYSNQSINFVPRATVPIYNRRGNYFPRTIYSQQPLLHPQGFWLFPTQRLITNENNIWSHILRQPTLQVGQLDFFYRVINHLQNPNRVQNLNPDNFNQYNHLQEFDFQLRQDTFNMVQAEIVSITLPQETKCKNMPLEDRLGAGDSLLTVEPCTTFQDRLGSGDSCVTFDQNTNIILPVSDGEDNAQVRISQKLSLETEKYSGENIPLPYKTHKSEMFSLIVPKSKEFNELNWESKDQTKEDAIITKSSESNVTLEIPPELLTQNPNLLVSSQEIFAVSIDAKIDNDLSRMPQRQEFKDIPPSNEVKIPQTPAQQTNLHYLPLDIQVEKSSVPEPKMSDIKDETKTEDCAENESNKLYQEREAVILQSGNKVIFEKTLSEVPANKEIEILPSRYDDKKYYDGQNVLYNEDMQAQNDPLKYIFRQNYPYCQLSVKASPPEKDFRALSYIEYSNKHSQNTDMEKALNEVGAEIPPIILPKEYYRVYIATGTHEWSPYDDWKKLTFDDLAIAGMLSNNWPDLNKPNMNNVIGFKTLQPFQSCTSSSPRDAEKKSEDLNPISNPTISKCFRPPSQENILSHKQHPTQTTEMVKNAERIATLRKKSYAESVAIPTIENSYQKWFDLNFPSLQRSDDITNVKEIPVTEKELTLRRHSFQNELSYDTDALTGKMCDTNLSSLTESNGHHFKSEERKTAGPEVILDIGEKRENIQCLARKTPAETGFKTERENKPFDSNFSLFASSFFTSSPIRLHTCENYERQNNLMEPKSFLKVKSSDLIEDSSVIEDHLTATKLVRNVEQKVENFPTKHYPAKTGARAAQKAASRIRSNSVLDLKYHHSSISLNDTSANSSKNTAVLGVEKLKMNSEKSFISSIPTNTGELKQAHLHGLSFHQPPELLSDSKQQCHPSSQEMHANPTAICSTEDIEHSSSKTYADAIQETADGTGQQKFRGQKHAPTSTAPVHPSEKTASDRWEQGNLHHQEHTSSIANSKETQQGCDSQDITAQGTITGDKEINMLRLKNPPSSADSYKISELKANIERHGPPLDLVFSELTTLSPEELHCIATADLELPYRPKLTQKRRQMKSRSKYMITKKSVRYPRNL